MKDFFFLNADDSGDLLRNVWWCFADGTWWYREWAFLVRVGCDACHVTLWRHLHGLLWAQLCSYLEIMALHTKRCFAGGVTLLFSWKMRRLVVVPVLLELHCHAWCLSCQCSFRWSPACDFSIVPGWYLMVLEGLFSLILLLFHEVQ